MSDNQPGTYDRIFIESVIEEFNELMIEKCSGEETVPLLGVCPKDKLPGDIAIWVQVFRSSEVGGKSGA